MRSRSEACFAADQFESRLQHWRALRQLRDSRAIDVHAAVAAKRDVFVGGVRDLRQAARDFRAQRAQRSVAHGAAFEAGRSARVGLELQPFEPADEMALDCHLAVLGDAGEQRIFALQPFEQRAGAAIDEALRQRFVQCVGKLVLDFARFHAPIVGVF